MKCNKGDECWNYQKLTQKAKVGHVVLQYTNGMCHGFLNLWNTRNPAMKRHSRTGTARLNVKWSYTQNRKNELIYGIG
jgi:hypothetical protein